MTASVETEQLLDLRRHALDLAHSRIKTNGTQETDPQRRQRITADANAWVEFVLAGKIYGS